MLPEKGKPYVAKPRKIVLRDGVTNPIQKTHSIYLILYIGHGIGSPEPISAELQTLQSMMDKEHCPYKRLRLHRARNSQQS